MNTRPSRLRAGTRSLIALALLLCVLIPTVATAAPMASTLASPCAPGVSYDQACDVDHDGDVDIFDIQLAAGHWNHMGTFNPSDNNHTHLGQTWTDGGNPLRLTGSFGAPDYAPLVLSNNAVGDGDGLRIASAWADGVQVDEAGFNGLNVQLAWDVGLKINSAGNYGVRVGNAGIDGVYVGTTGGDGVAVNWAGDDGYFIDKTGSAASYGGNAGNNGMEIGNVEDYGVYVNAAGQDGVAVVSAGDAGMQIVSAGTDGVRVGTAGNPSSQTSSPLGNGFEVAGAEGYGLYIGRADFSGVRVFSASEYGVLVNSVGSTGVHVDSANYGLNVGGNHLAGYFRGDIQVTGNCSGCLLATFGVNAGDVPLAPGDVLSLASLRESGVDSVPMLLEVQRAKGGDTVMGVVQGWAELVTEEEPRPDEIGLRLVPREGAVEPGQYVTIAYSGLTQVKATGPIVQGSRLAVGDNGSARALRTVTVDGVELAENIAVIGTALESLEGDGLVWVLVNPQ